MIWRALLPGFRLFDQAETPLRIEYRKSEEGIVSPWQTLFAAQPFRVRDFFYNPYHIVRLLINNIALEFLEKDLPRFLPTGPYPQAYTQLVRYIRHEAESATFQFRLLTVKEEISIGSTRNTEFSEILFLSPWHN